MNHTFIPRGTARAIFEDRSSQVLIAGPAGTGKSRAALEKLHFMCLINPGMKALIVRKTHASLTTTGLRTLEDHVIAEALATGDIHWYGGSGAQPAGYIYSNGSTIAVGGMDNPMKIMSSEYDFVYAQEATELTEEDWEAITTRLRNGKVSFQQLLADCNPQAPTHWLKMRCDAGLTVMYESKHEENPRYFDDEGNLTSQGEAYMKTLDNLTGIRKLRLRDGKWAGAEGLIYDMFDNNTHIIPPFDIPESWNRYWSVDIGFTNPTVIQCWAEDTDGRLYLYRELYMTGMTMDEHAKVILDYVAPNGTWIEPYPVAIIMDHDGQGRPIFERVIGMGSTAAQKRVSEGIQLVQARLTKAADGLPRLFIFNNALIQRDQSLVERKQPTSTADEMVRYIWDTKKDQPVKEYDHGMDAMRYLVAHRDLGSTFRMTWT